MTYAERVGNYMPPMIIFPTKHMKAELLDGTPVEFWGESHELGWMQSNRFLV